MELVLMGVTAGVSGTLVMDVLNLLLARIGILAQIDVRMIGKASYGWMRGRFLYEHPSELPQISGALVRGYVTHYLIGVTLAIAYLIGWHLFSDSPPSAVWAIVYGVATTVAAYFFLLPSIGLGICGRHSPQGIKLPLTSLINHLFYGLGLAGVIALS